MSLTGWQLPKPQSEVLAGSSIDPSKGGVGKAPSPEPSSQSLWEGAELPQADDGYGNPPEPGGCGCSGRQERVKNHWGRDGEETEAQKKSLSLSWSPLAPAPALPGLPLSRSVPGAVFNTRICFEHPEHIKAGPENLRGSLLSVTKAAAESPHSPAPPDTNYSCQTRCGLPPSLQSSLWCLAPSLRRLQSLPEVRDIPIPPSLPVYLWKALLLKHGTEAVLVLPSLLPGAAFRKFLPLINHSWSKSPLAWGQTHTQLLLKGILQFQFNNRSDQSFYSHGKLWCFR